MAIAVDSSVWIDFFTKRDTQQTSELRRILADDLVLVLDLVLYEVLRGTRSEAHSQELETVMQACMAIDASGWSTSVNAARNYRHLRSRAVTPRSSIDVLIATWCIDNAVALLHNDRDFLAMEQHLGLKVWRSSDPSPQLA